MIFHSEFLKQVKSGKIKRTYRRWEKPVVKVGGTQKTSVGVIQFTLVKQVAERSLTTAQARAAGFETLEELKKMLSYRADGKIYEIGLRYFGADPRLKLRRKAKLSEKEMNDVLTKLAKMDKLSRRGNWTKEFLELIRKNPGVRAKDLAPQVGFEEFLKFKVQVRKLKAMGLTISLETGYKLSPRGKVILNALRSKSW